MTTRWAGASAGRAIGLGVVTLLLVAGCSSSTSTVDDTGPAGPAAVEGSATTPATSVAACGTPPAASADPGAPAATLAATQAFLGTLDETQRTTVSGERTAANLGQWSNLPDELFERAGLRMDALSAEQQEATFAVLQAALSPEGYQQVRQISTADGVLAATAQMSLDFGGNHYWVRVLGTPATTGAWTVQYGGHHLAVNVTLDGDAMTLAPTFWGAQPSSYTAAGTAAEPLCGETTRAFALMNALDADQQQQAILDTPVTEIVLGAGQDGRTLAAEGVSASTFTPEQQALLLELVDEWIRPINGARAAPKLEAARQGLAQTTFAWSGQTTIGQPIYYRIQGPSVTIEFAHQQGQGANAGGITHIHAIYREPGNDYLGQSG